MNNNAKCLWLMLCLMLPSGIVLAGSELIQSGYQIQIVMPGEPSFTQPFEVDRAGRLQLPEVGAVPVAELDEVQMAQAVTQALSLAYRDLSGLKVYVAAERIRIQVMGYVQTPGEITMEVDAGVQIALQQAGGLRPGAQLDRMQLRRAGEQQVFDYKQYLDSGDLNALPELKSLDTIFVPASSKIGNVATVFDPVALNDKGDAAETRTAIKVFGEVFKPGSFSFRQNASLVDMLMRAGGVTRYASVEQVRVIIDGQPMLFNLTQYLDTGNEALMPQLQPGTTIFVPKQQEEIKAGANTVYVMGEVFKPGAYEGHNDAGFLDVLANAGGPTRFAETRQIRVIRQGGDIEAFDLLAYTEGLNANLPQIAAGDAIFVPEKTDLNEKSWTKVAPNRAVQVMGEVNRPGRFEWSDEMSLMDLLAHAGGPKRNADTANIQIVIALEDGKTDTVRFNLNHFLSGKMVREQLPAIAAGSLVMVPELPDDPSDNKSQWVRQASDDSIYVFGQVGAPGRYRFDPEMHFLDILAAADGPNGNADISNVRISHRNGKTAKISKLDLGLYFETGDENLLPTVIPGDSIYIPEKDRPWLAESKESTVRVLGAVGKPGRYRFNDDMTLLDLLAEAGGINDNSYPEKITVVNLSCCRDQARSFDLLAFSQTGNFAMLPVLRAGDTVYVPSEKDSDWFKARQGLEDIFRVVSISALLGFI